MRVASPACGVMQAEIADLRLGGLFAMEPTSGVNGEAYDEADGGYLGLGLHSRREGTVGTGRGYGP